MLNIIKLIFLHAHWMILELLRSPAYVVSTIAFPALFYAIFAIPESIDIPSSNMLVASFSCFAVFGVLFLQFGVGVSQERSKSWYRYIRTLPLNQYKLVIARFLSAQFFSLLASVGIIIMSLIFTYAQLSFFEWLKFIILLHLAGIPFCFMGLALGYFSNEKSSLPIGNLIYLPLSFAGGLWKPPSILPEMLREVSAYLPTRYYGDILWSYVAHEKIKNGDIYGLLVYGAIFALLAYIGFKREEALAR